ncbi:phage major capsid protein [Holzapfeliella sp. JNUCC 72]
MNNQIEKRLNPDADLSTTPTKASGEEDVQNLDAEQEQNNTKNKADEDTKNLSGYAIVFGQPSKDLGGFKEVIDKEALDGVDLSDVYLVNNHDLSQVLASTKGGTLKLETDEKGLHFEATLSKTTLASDTYENVKAGNLSSMSFSFITADDGDEFTKTDDGVIRTIKKVKSLFDVSLVAIPSYDDTNVQVNKRSYQEFLNSQKQENKGDNSNMKTKTLIQNEEKTEYRSFEDYIRSQGEQRDGLTTDNAKVVVPSGVIGDIFEEKTADNSLSKFVTVKKVGNPMGVYPVAVNQKGTLKTKKEGESIEDINAEMFKGVEYKVETRAGKIYLSNELVEDAEVDIISEVKSQLQQLVDNTDNANILDVFKKFKKMDAANVDDLKQIYNVELNPAFNKKIVTNQSGFNWLDTLKDKNDNYILQNSISAPSSKSLFGADIIVHDDEDLPNSKDGKLPMFMGDMQQACLVALKNQVQVQWQQFDSYSQGLAVVLRNDYKQINDKSLRYIEITPQ